MKCGNCSSADGLVTQSESPELEVLFTCEECGWTSGSAVKAVDEFEFL